MTPIDSWRPKPRIAWGSKLIHVGWGAASPFLGWLWFYLMGWPVYPGLAFGGLVCILIGWLWEHFTPWLGPQGWHPFGDVLDWLAFVLGVVVGGVPAVFLAG